MRTADKSALETKLAALRASRPAPEPAKHNEPAHKTPEPIGDGLDFMLDTLEELGEEYVTQIDSDVYVREIVDAIGIVQAYQKWVPKPYPEHPRVANGGELMVSCPLPEHPDRNPSASINPETDLWVCHACAEGGDVISLIGRMKNLDPRVPQEYMELTKGICRDLGYEFQTNVLGHEEIVQRGEKAAPQPVDKPVDTVPVHGADVVFDLEDQVASGAFERPKPADISESYPELLSTLDEMNDVGSKQNTEKDSILARVKADKADRMAKEAAKKGDSEPEKPAETAPEPPKTAVKPVEKAPEPPIVAKKPQVEPEKPRSRPSGAGAFLAGLDPDRSGPKKPISAPKADQNGPKADLQPPKADQERPKSSKKVRGKTIQEPDWYIEQGKKYEPGAYITMPTGTPWLDIDKVIAPDSMFLRRYMDFAQRDSAAPEWHFWCGLTALGFAAGREAWVDGKRLFGNLFVCLTGQSGSGKSQAQRYLLDLLNDALPINEADAYSTGVNVAYGIGSGEKLVKEFTHTVEMPDMSKKQLADGSYPLRSETGANLKVLAVFEEFSTIAAKSKSDGSTLRDKLITIYDGSTIGARSLSNEQTVKDPFGSVSATTQPNNLAGLLDKSEVVGGYVSRWIFAPGREKAQHALYDDIEGYDSRTLTPALQKIHAWAQGRGEIPFEPQAKKLFTGFFAEEIVPFKRGEDADAKARVDVIVKKLCLLFALDIQAERINTRIVMQAMQCWTYIKDSIEFLLGKMTQTAASESEREILSAIEESEDGSTKIPGMTTREVNDKFKRRQWAPDIPKILLNMASRGLIEERQPTGARKKKWLTSEGD